MSRRWFGRGRATAGLLTVVLTSTSMPAAAHVSTTGLWRLEEPKVTPADAEARRVPVQQRAQALASAGDFRSAAIEYDNAAAELGDPVLFLDAAQAYLDGAADEREAELARGAIERARKSLDISYFHLDSTADKDYRLVDASDVAGLIVRANEIIDRAESLIEEIELEAAAPLPAPEEKRERKAKPGRLKIISGAALASVGGGLLVMGIAGLGLGAARQNEAEDPTVYGEEYDSVEQRGKRANVIAGVGLALGALATGAGIALILLGRKDAKKAAGDDRVVRMGPMFGSGSGGFTLSGRF